MNTFLFEFSARYPLGTTTNLALNIQRERLCVVWSEHENTVIYSHTRQKIKYVLLPLEAAEKISNVDKDTLLRSPSSAYGQFLIIFLLNLLYKMYMNEIKRYPFIYIFISWIMLTAAEPGNTMVLL